ncbi:hypothetical protein BDV96DRAFT_570072 [Lophiotrema nucula]|uniref:GCN5-related N-acetyltransferase Rv2170-like domain-containing protein n=1 Tax=Lophiotrema nucula TaxID=690887 RepID=A0A6A5ZG89_9PLEO|nr:hypothetical protein BDV96DRAFT_570072 [Lophiotrema nucula]
MARAKMPPTVYEHKADSPILQKALQQTLPNSVSLTYRTQHTNKTPDAHIVATFPPFSQDIPKCWATCYYDRSMRPETEMWIFATGEIEGHHSSPDGGFCPQCQNAVLAIVDYLSILPVPPMHPDNLYKIDMAKEHEKEYPETGDHVRYPLTSGSYLRHLLIPSVVTLGACHHAIVKIFDEAGLLRNEFPGKEADLNKFIFKVSDLPQTKELPENLHWGTVREEDIATVQARTSIPRTTRTLMSMKSVGVFNDKDTPAAWTFLGLDGSLTTLHTEPEHRGKGIAKAVAAKTFRQYAPGLAVDTEGNAWAHADVYAGNVQSEGVCRSLGGRIGWKSFWVRIDVGRAGQLAATDES